MRRRVHGRAMLALAMISAATPAVAQAPGMRSAVISQACPRECLIGLIRKYMAALAAHSPSTLPVTRDVMFTENDVAIPL